MNNGHIVLGSDIIAPRTEEVKRHKIQSEQICSILEELAQEQEKHSKAQNIANCGTWLNFRQYHDENNTRTLHSANFCKSPLCPMCAWRKALKLTRQVGNAILLSDKRYIYHVVMASDNTMQLTKDIITRFKSNATRFIKKYLSDEYAIALEITYNEAKGFHPHVHAIVTSDAFIKVSAEYIKHMATMWASYNKSVHAQNTFFITGITDREKASRELTKYILKYEGIDVAKDKEAIKDIARATAGLKKIQSAGQLLKDIARTSKEYNQDRERETKELEKNGYDLEIFHWVNGDYIRTN